MAEYRPDMEKQAEWPARGRAAVSPFPGDILPSRTVVDQQQLSPGRELPPPTIAKTTVPTADVRITTDSSPVASANVTSRDLTGILITKIPMMIYVLAVMGTQAIGNK